MLTPKGVCDLGKQSFRPLQSCLETFNVTGSNVNIDQWNDLESYGEPNTPLCVVTPPRLRSEDDKSLKQKEMRFN